MIVIFAFEGSDDDVNLVVVFNAIVVASGTTLAVSGIVKAVRGVGFGDEGVSSGLFFCSI